ncbi:hypothetical protein BC939DRAFT_504338 [Gamsiella multidivaricata]|uniref:uncharacterized protein n=1 Tax=Gamsiella multidivaricata TaxID=101098 RepID=UPI0022210813|nr:uncharacterized protein BC939DRAFT_504338 [Gamsiella multidivaricata]KAG0369106.1 hypothetical protein BGZ54_000293 [Gamsiella multidivaricata]KAI7821550.1 hypothetical protein BC939DRAFT_504338 [Gamsiella multidivaricata]
MPLKYTLRRPVLEWSQQSTAPEHQAAEAERGHAVIDDLRDYPVELFHLRVRSIQEQLSHHHPPTYIYIAALASILLLLLVFIATALALHVSDGKPWVLGVIVVLIMTFVAKMFFLSRIEKAHKEINILLHSFNNQDMPHYDVLYRLRPGTFSFAHSSFLNRCAYRLNLGLPSWVIDLTTVDHIDEYSFQEHPATDPHALPEEVLARENELPTYRSKEYEEEEHGDGMHRHQGVFLSEGQPPEYQQVVIEMETHSRPALAAPPASETGAGAGTLNISVA